MCLINSTLCIFYLSFFKVPKTVRDTIIKIQRDFLWGNENGKRKICWESWDLICLPKKLGGLGVKNVFVFIGHFLQSGGGN